MALRLGLPTRAWLNYESGIVIPGPVLLRFLLQTGVSPDWLAGEPIPPASTLAGASAGIEPGRRRPRATS